MALQTSGPLSLNDIHVEAGGSSGTSVGINDSDVRALIAKGNGAQMSFNEWYGASSYIFDKSRDAATYGAPADGSGGGQLCSGSGNASTWQMNATAAYSSCSMGMATNIPLTSGTQYTCYYDISVTSPLGTTSVSLGNNIYGYSSGVTSTMQVSNYINHLAGLVTVGDYRGGTWAETGSGFQFYSGLTSGTQRISGTFNFTPGSSVPGVGLLLGQSKVGNNNSQVGSLTVHALTIQ